MAGDELLSIEAPSCHPAPADSVDSDALGYNFETTSDGNTLSQNDAVNWGNASGINTRPGFEKGRGSGSGKKRKNVGIGKRGITPLVPKVPQNNKKQRQTRFRVWHIPTARTKPCHCRPTIDSALPQGATQRQQLHTLVKSSIRWWNLKLREGVHCHRKFGETCAREGSGEGVL
eukprot:1732973-Amphidinium_carterae.2